MSDLATVAWESHLRTKLFPTEGVYKDLGFLASHIRNLDRWASRESFVMSALNLLGARKKPNFCEGLYSYLSADQHLTVNPETFQSRILDSITRIV
jgi:hypothetical protein